MQPPQQLSDAYKLLGCTAQHTIDDVKNQFKRLALVYHPDKGGDPVVFNNIVESFKMVFRHKKAISEDVQHHDLKTRSQSHMGHTTGIATPPANGASTPSPPPPTGRAAEIGPRFSKNDADFQNKFNRFFDEHRTVDENVGRGYEGFITAPEVKVSTNHYKIKKYEDPVGTVLCKSLGFHELGKKIDDYSGKNDDMHKLQYTDYMYAHTTDKIIDPTAVKERREFKNMDDIRASREAESFELTDRDRKMYERSRARETRREQRRQTNLQQYDQYLTEHQQRINQLSIR